MKKKAKVRYGKLVICNFRILERIVCVEGAMRELGGSL
jgi:hypothetical protein